MLRLFARKKVDPKEKLGEILEGFELPTFPAIHLEALRLARDVDSDTAELADALSADPGLTGQVLSTVNASAFGLRSRVRSVHHAVSLLGRSQIESLVVALASRACLPADAMPGFDPKSFWSIAARRAAVARGLNERIDPSQRSEVFSASLLQDMAIPLLCRSYGERYGGLVERSQSEDCDLIPLEQEAFGWDHAQVAAMMCSIWGFPEAIGEAIAVHHGSEDSEAQPLVAVSLVAELCETRLEESSERLIGRATEELGQPAEQVRQWVEDGLADGEELAGHFA
ncbi:hypothetical protein ABI59_11640 [Acidobacteria bacterium Mor1]|nr:hypothetical protein ABI59_11640 [Acidobacteria bacterium Mor1]